MTARREGSGTRSGSQGQGLTSRAHGLSIAVVAVSAPKEFYYDNYYAMIPFLSDVETLRRENL
ncbi:MAG: hypothetical protein ACYDBH_07265 [Acidobacteriaceae bacterium]